MNQLINVGGEGASTHIPRPPTASIPSVVVLPYFMPSAPMTFDAQIEIYRLAYERAQAALRPSPYELAARFAAN